MGIATILATTAEPDKSCRTFPPVNGKLGDCPSDLPSGASCLPVCLDGYTVSGPARCLNGNLFMATCMPTNCSKSDTPGASARCMAGKEYNARSRCCDGCALGKYKSISGKGACESCPPGSTTFQTGSDSLSKCICNSTSYRVDGQGQGLQCMPCPD